MFSPPPASPRKAAPGFGPRRDDEAPDTREATTTMEARKHPDLFTPGEAAEYLHLESVNTLETLERDHKLQRCKAGKSVLYWRKDLDAVAYSIAGEPVPPELRRVQTLRLQKERA